MMRAPDDPRRELIETALALQTGPRVDAAVLLWERLGPELLQIVGNGGFKALYSRSVRLTSVLYPWLAHDMSLPLDSQLFAELKRRLQTQDEAMALQGGLALLTTFVDTLSSLIGESLTEHILRSAWRLDALNRPESEAAP